MRIIACVVLCIAALQAQESYPTSRPTGDRARLALRDRGVDPSMRVEAARALRAARGKAREALPDLAAALAATSDESLRFELITAVADILTGLYQSAYEREREPEATRVDMTPESYAQTIEGFAESIVDELRKALRDGDQNTVWSAAVAIGRLGSEAAAAKAEVYSACRRAKGDALVNVAWAAAQLRWHSIDALEPMIAVLEGTEEAAKGHAALVIDALTRDGADLSRAVPALEATLGSKDLYAVHRAVSALGSIGAPAIATVPKLLAIAKTTPDERLRIGVVDAIAGIDPTKNDDVPYLLSLLKSDDYSSQLSALIALGKGKRLDSVAVDALMPALRGTVERWGAHGLQGFIANFPKSPELAEYFLAAAKRASGDRLAEWMPGLVAVGVDKETRLELLDEIFESTDGAPRWKILTDSLLVAGLEEPEVVKELERLSRHKNPEVAAAALETLKAIRPDDAAETVWKVVVERLDAGTRAESAPTADESADEYESYRTFEPLRELAKSKDGKRFFDRMVNEFKARRGANRRHLFEALTAANPTSEASTAALETMIAGSDPSDRVCALSFLESSSAPADRITRIEAMLGDAADSVRSEAFLVLQRMAPNSPKLRQAVLSDDPAFAGGRLRSLIDLVKAGERSAEVVRAVGGLLESKESYTFKQAVELMTRLAPGVAPSSGPASASDADEPPNERRSRLEHAVLAMGSRSTTVENVARLAPWISWTDPNLTVVVLRAVRAAGRSGAPFVPAIRGLFEDRDAVNSALEALPESARNGWYGLVLTEALMTLSGLGSDAGSAAPEIAKFFSDRAPLPSIVEQVLRRIAGEGRLRAVVAVKPAAAPLRTTLTVDGADSVAPPSETVLDGFGERRIVVARSGAESGSWLEFVFFKDAGDRAAVEVSAFEFRTDAKPFVQSIALTEARIVMTDPAWFDLPTAGGTFAITAGDKIWTGSFAFTTMLFPESDDEEKDQ